MDLDESDNNINIINFNSDQRSDNNNANIIRNNPSENDYQFCGLISGMNRYKTISLGNTEKIKIKIMLLFRSKDNITRKIWRIRKKLSFGNYL